MVTSINAASKNTANQACQAHTLLTTQTRHQPIQCRSKLGHALALQNPQQGMTLIELLIVLLILSLLLGLALTSYRFFTAQWEQRSHLGNQGIDQVRLQQRFHRVIEAYQDYYVLVQTNPYQSQRLPYFYGQADHVRLVSQLSLINDQAGALIQLTLRPREPEGLQLVHQEWSLDRLFVDDLTLPPNPDHEQIIFDHLQSASFSFFGFENHQQREDIWLNIADAPSTQARAHLLEQQLDWYTDYRIEDRHLSPLFIRLDLRNEEGQQQSLYFELRAESPVKRAQLNEE